MPVVASGPALVQQARRAIGVLTCELARSQEAQTGSVPISVEWDIPFTDLSAQIWPVCAGFR
jgi:hypothetical protein